MNNFLSKVHSFRHRTAILEGHKYYTYEDLLRDSKQLAYTIRSNHGDSPIPFLVNPGYLYVVTLWAIWRAGAMAVPLSPRHPQEAYRHLLKDSNCRLLVVEEPLRSRISPLALEMGIEITDTSTEAGPDTCDDMHNKEALLLYTSGSTSAPKGVVLSHDNLQAQMDCLSQAWEWDSRDHILNVLPLHHVHGIVNVVSCALWNGATCEFLVDGFDPQKVLNRILMGKINLFMAVPTIYYQLIKAWESLDEDRQHEISGSLENFRLMVSGSAALPVETLRKWKKISGHTLLERYGMTEIGMALSNPFHGKRHPGHVGWPLPGVQVRLMENGREVQEGDVGEIWVKSPTVFKRYWNLPRVTAESFQDGWFKTGDLAKKRPNGYQILGRNSVDIIKSGGYKISALEIEDVLLTHSAIKECGVVGLPDREWGEKIVAALVADDPLPTLDELDLLVTTKLPSYQKPRKYVFLSQLPRNALGKLVKPKLKQELINRGGEETKSHK